MAESRRYWKLNGWLDFKENSRLEKSARAETIGTGGAAN
jgi:hypothetical protein